MPSPLILTDNSPARPNASVTMVSVAKTASLVSFLPVHINILLEISTCIIIRKTLLLTCFRLWFCICFVAVAIWTVGGEVSQD